MGIHIWSISSSASERLDRQNRSKGHVKAVTFTEFARRTAPGSFLFGQADIGPAGKEVSLFRGTLPMTQQHHIFIPAPSKVNRRPPVQ
jgi:hypothetical protein